MTPIEMMIWSMAVGTVGAVVLSGLANAVTLRRLDALQGAAYHLTAMVFVFLLRKLAAKTLGRNPISAAVSFTN